MLLGWLRAAATTTSLLRSFPIQAEQVEKNLLTRLRLLVAIFIAHLECLSGLERNRQPPGGAAGNIIVSTPLLERRRQRRRQQHQQQLHLRAATAAGQSRYRHAALTAAGIDGGRESCWR